MHLRNHFQCWGAFVADQWWMFCCIIIIIITSSSSSINISISIVIGIFVIIMHYYYYALLFPSCTKHQSVSEYQEYPNVHGPRSEKIWVTGQKLTWTDLQPCGSAWVTVVTELPKPAFGLWLLSQESTVAGFYLELTLLRAVVFVWYISWTLKNNVKVSANTLAARCCSLGSVFLFLWGNMIVCKAPFQKYIIGQAIADNYLCSVLKCDCLYSGTAFVFCDILPAWNCFHSWIKSVNLFSIL